MIKLNTEDIAICFENVSKAIDQDHINASRTQRAFYLLAGLHGTASTAAAFGDTEAQRINAIIETIMPHLAAESAGMEATAND